jgi:hypothetical protein
MASFWPMQAFNLVQDGGIDKIRLKESVHFCFDMSVRSRFHHQENYLSEAQMDPALQCHPQSYKKDEIRLWSLSKLSYFISLRFSSKCDEFHSMRPQSHGCEKHYP